MRGDLKIGILPVIVGGFHVSVGPSSVSAVDLRTEGPKVGVHRDRTLQGSEELDGLYFCCSLVSWDGPNGCSVNTTWGGGFKCYFKINQIYLSTTVSSPRPS